MYKKKDNMRQIYTYMYILYIHTSAMYVTMYICKPKQNKYKPLQNS